MNNFINGKLQQMPQMQFFNQMMSGKNPQQQIETIKNIAESRGIDLNAKIFSEQDLKMFGLNIPRKGWISPQGLTLQKTVL